MNAKTYLLIAIIGGVLVVFFSPSLFFLLVERELPKTALERKVYEPLNYTILNKIITIPNGVRLRNESLQIVTVGNDYKLLGSITSNSSVTFMLFDDIGEFQKFLDGSSSYNTIIRVGLEPNVEYSFSKGLESGKSSDLEFVFINLQGRSCNIDMTLTASYLVEDVDIDYVPDLIRGILFPSLCVVGLIIFLFSFVKLRMILKASPVQEKTSF